MTMGNFGHFKDNNIKICEEPRTGPQKWTTFFITHPLLVVLQHHEVCAGILQGLDVGLFGGQFLFQVLHAVVEAGEAVDLLLVLKGDVHLVVL